MLRQNTGETRDTQDLGSARASRAPIGALAEMLSVVTKTFRDLEVRDGEAPSQEREARALPRVDQRQKNA